MQSSGDDLALASMNICHVSSTPLSELFAHFLFAPCLTRFAIGRTIDWSGRPFEPGITLAGLRGEMRPNAASLGFGELMRQLPRVAVGTLQPEASHEPVVWGLLAALRAIGHEATCLQSSSYLASHDAARSLTGSAGRHLDSWAMSRSACLRTMLRASHDADLAIVEGRFDVSVGAGNHPQIPGGSSLDTLADWLEMPRVAIVDVRSLEECQLPERPTRLDGLILDRVSDLRHAAYWQTTLEAVWKAPVFGWLDEAASLRTLCETLPAGRDPSPELCAALGRRLLANFRLDKLAALADRWPLPSLPVDDALLDLAQRSLRIAIAYDEEHCGYFPDTLDLLEASGAQLCDFSPLRDGTLPDGADVVYLGSGHPERQIDAIAGNHCLHQSLRCFAASGGRIYAEGSGLAYLCREVALPCSRRLPMTGLLPAVARLLPQAGPHEPTEITFATDSWMVEAGTMLRGYRHPAWQIEPSGPMVTYAQDPQQRFDMLGLGNVVGSRILVNLAANEHLLRRFVEPATVPVGVRRR